MDVAQAIVMYLAMLGCLYLFCWLGNELSEQVKSNLYLYTYTLRFIFNIMKKNCRIFFTVPILCNFQQAESVRHAAWECDWVGSPVPFQRCLVFFIASANKEFRLTAGKFVPVANVTLMNVSILSIKVNAF